MRTGTPSSSASACAAAAQPPGVHAARVAHDADALLDRLLQHRAQRHRDEVGGIAFLRPLHARAGEDRHRQLGEIVEHQVVDAARAHQLQRP
jgi:hypothetical protein